ARFRCFQDFNCTPEASFGNSQGTADQFNFLVGFRFTFRPEEAVGCSDTNFVCSQRLRAAKWEICGNKCRFYTAFSQKMHENFFVRRRLPGFSLHFAFELAEHDKLIGVGLLAASINLQVAQDQRAPAVLLQENKWIWRFSLSFLMLIVFRPLRYARSPRLSSRAKREAAPQFLRTSSCFRKIQ